MRIITFYLLVLISTSGAAQASSLKIGLSLPTQREERWFRDRKVMEAESKRLGIDLRVQTADNDAAKQILQCESLLLQGIKVLIVAPHDASSASRIVELASRNKVPVISYDRLISHSLLDYYYLSFDNQRVGQLQGEFLKTKVPKGTYIILAGAPTDNNAKLYHQGALELLQPLANKKEIRIAMDHWVKDWQPAEAQKLCEQALTANSNKIDAVLAPNDGTAGGCIQALAAQGLAGKIAVTGQDSELAAIKRIVEGTQSMTIFKDTRELGKTAMEMALDLARGKTIKTKVSVFNGKKQIPSILLVPQVITQENLYDILIKSGYFKKEHVYKKL